MTDAAAISLRDLVETKSAIATGMVFEALSTCEGQRVEKTRSMKR